MYGPVHFQGPVRNEQFLCLGERWEILILKLLKVELLVEGGGAKAGPMTKLGKNQWKMYIGPDPHPTEMENIIFFRPFPSPYTTPFNQQFLHSSALRLKFLTSPPNIKIAHFSRDPESAQART